MNFFSSKIVSIKKEDILKDGYLTKQSRMLKTWREYFKPFKPIYLQEMVCFD